MQLIINLRKKYFMILTLGMLLISGGFLVYAYGTNNPSVFGHSWGEIDGVPETATRWPTWSEIVGIPGTLSDGIISWSEITNIPNVLSDGIISWSEITNLPNVLSDGIVSWSEIANMPNVLSDGIVGGNEIDWNNVVLPQNIKLQLKGDTGATGATGAQGPAGAAGSSVSDFISGGLYGYCSTNSLAGGCSAVSPASCHATYCECDSGYTRIYLSGEVGYPVYRIMCLKN